MYICHIFSPKPCVVGFLLPTNSVEIILASNRAGTIAGAIIGTLLALVFIGAILFCCHRKRREEKYEKEVHHDIR